MKYYKLISDNQIIGAINSNNFISLLPITNCFIISDEEQGEYIDYNGHIYRSSWMQPAHSSLDFELIQAIEITEQEYNNYTHALQQNQIIEEAKEEPQVVEKYVTPSDATSLDFIKDSKLKEMSYICRTTIEQGFDLELREEIHHFSLDTQDQLNLMSLSVMAQTQSLIPYHADGEECVFYTAEEINEIVDTANSFKIYHTTYYNALKAYINSLDDINAIAAIEYGIEIPEGYQTDVLKALIQ